MTAAQATRRRSRKRLTQLGGGGGITRTNGNGRAAVAVRENKHTAKEARLHYVSDESPGIRRIPSGKGFTYVKPDGKRLKNSRDIARIKQLAIPPAYRDVWICPDPNGHIQPSAATRAGGSSTAITRAGERSGTETSTTK